MKVLVTFLIAVSILVSCRVSYQFNGASIDYNLTKTIDIKDFNNQALRVYAPLTQVFSETVRDHFTKNTKLSFTKVNPDLELEGEIISYELSPLSAKEESNGIFASETRLTMNVRIRYINNKKPEENKETTISSYRDFSSDKNLTDVEDQLIDELSKDIADQIFNATMSNW